MPFFVFQRIEKKYLIDEEKYKQIIKKILPFIKEDAFFNYLVANIYFDTEDSDIIRKSIEKPVFKEKLRLRGYGTPKSNSKVFLEIKRKFNGVVSKRRISLTLKEATAFIEKGIKPKGKGLIADEIDYFIKNYSVKPKIYISYKREAYTGKQEKDLRITFDRDIISRTTSLKLQSKAPCTKLLQDDKCVFEIKSSNPFPIWLVKTLSELKIYPLPFSKYGNIYQESFKIS